MKSSNWSRGAIAIIILVQYVPLQEAGIFKITDDRMDQWSPALYDDIIVWQEWTHDTYPSALNFGIFGHNLSTGETLKIAENVSNQENPAIYGDIVVWQDDRNGTYDIYGYNLSTREEFRITEDSHNQEYPAIYGDIVVWQDDRNGTYDIYGYNLSTREEFRITEDSHNQEYPAIYGDIVVWEDDRNDNCDVYGVSLSTGREFQITKDLDRQSSPYVYESTVLWQDRRGGTSDIYGFDLSTEREFVLISRDGDQLWPRMYENSVVWTDHSGDRWDIWGYDFLNHEEFWISGGENALVYGDIVVWIGKDTNDQLDLYGCELHIVRAIREADHLLAQGEEAFEKKEYEEALECFQKARELYSEAGSEKTGECDEWIQKTREAKGGFCLGTGLLAVVVAVGLLGISRDRHGSTCLHDMYEGFKSHNLRKVRE